MPENCSIMNAVWVFGWGVGGVWVMGGRGRGGGEGGG